MINICRVVLREGIKAIRRLFASGSQSYATWASTGNSDMSNSLPQPLQTSSGKDWRFLSIGHHSRHRRPARIRVEPGSSCSGIRSRNVSMSVSGLCMTFPDSIRSKTNAVSVFPPPKVLTSQNSANRSPSGNAASHPMLNPRLSVDGKVTPIWWNSGSSTA